MIAIRVEYWTGGEEPELVHTFYSLYELINHFNHCKEEGAYGKNFYRLWYPEFLDELRLNHIPSGDVLTAHWYRGLEESAVA
ncbi:MAG: hypothetical protein HOG34_19080 [Bacteroidetes bacterium]|nr:hypothetical protein [Bacteroidota bacterium]